MQNYDIKTDETGRELIEHGTSMFPIAAYDEYFSMFVLHEVPWHWHEEIEVVLVCEGSTRVEYLDGSVILESGDGIFINSNCLHRMTQVGDTDCHIINFVFHPSFIGGRYDSKINRDFVAPICNNETLSIIKLSRQVPWQKEALSCIQNGFDLLEDTSFGYELMLSSHLIELWHLLCVNHRDVFCVNRFPTESKKRLDQMIKYIHGHYHEKLSVKELASVASISESECYRLFNKVLNESPIEYVTKHRLQMGASKLAETNASILAIALDIGFNSPSYFSMKFKDQYKMTPRQFRKLHKE